ncbi:MAG: hypothetical protein JNM43_17005 [Planctomycetaceae bacterium]|nr:hypothetical protein [Planctomycetaceae bacterium]
MASSSSHDHQQATTGISSKSAATSERHGGNGSSLLWKILLVMGVIATAWLLLDTRMSLGVPSEWTWPRLMRPDGFWSLFDRLVPALFAAMAVIGVSLFVDRRMERRSILFQCGVIVALWGMAFVWQAAARQAAPSPHRELRPLWILYDRYATGYFWQAREIASTDKWLAEYSDRMKQGDVLHEGTHPPGLVLWNRWALNVTQNSPVMTDWLFGTASEEQLSMFREMETQARFGKALTRSELAALQLTVLMSFAFSALLPVVVYSLLCLTGETHEANRESRTAWRAAVVSIAIPTLAVFSPRSDVLYATSGLILLTLMLAAVLSSRPIVRILISVLCGVWMFGCLMFSLAHVPVLVSGLIFLVVRLLCERWVPSNTDRSVFRMAISAGVALAAFVCCVFVFWKASQCNLADVWIQNLRNHEAFYDQSPRTWWKWLLVNPLELTLAVGVGLSLMGIKGVWDSIRAVVRRDFVTANVQLTLAMFLTWLMLWLSGKNMGEAARLWCFLTPWVVVASAAAGARFSLRDRGAWLWVLAVQCIVSVLTTGLVSGYLQLAG